MTTMFTLRRFTPSCRSGTRPRSGPFRILLAHAHLVLALLLGLPTLSLGQTTPPTMTSTMNFPQFRSSYISGTTINVQSTPGITAGSATVITGTIDSVSFYYDNNFFAGHIDELTYGTRLGKATAAPYSINWTPPLNTTATEKKYFVRAIAYGSYPPVGGGARVVIFAINNGSTKYNEISVFPTNYVSTRNWYVSASAPTSPTPDGTFAKPYVKIQDAADKVAPGDTVFVMAGTYSNTSINIVGIQRTGLPGKSIVFKPYRTDKPVLQMGNNNFNAFNVLPAAAYLKIQGFEVIGNNATNTLARAQAQAGACEGTNKTGTPIARFNGNGISVSGRTGGNLRPHHVVIASNSVHDCGGAGISAVEADYVTVEDNTSSNNSWYTVYGTSGFSIFNSWNSDNSTAIKMILRRNRSFGNILKVAWNIGGTGTNCKFYDGNGIILDNNNASKNPNGGYTGKFLIENNLCYLNGGRGINVNFTDNTVILNNTTYRNGVSDGGPGVGIESEFIAQGASGIQVYNNTFSGRPGEKVTEVNSSAIEHNNNLTFEGTGTSYFSGNQNKTGVDPQFVDAANGDFTLLQTSPAVNAGSKVNGQFAAKDLLGVDRPQGSGTDIGAYELQGVPITISQQPAGSDTVCTGGTATASVIVDGPGPVSYQWLKDGNPILNNASASTSTLSLTALTAAEAGSYTVVVMAFNQLTSSAFVLTVSPLPTATISGTTALCKEATAPAVTFTGASARHPTPSPTRSTTAVPRPSRPPRATPSLSPSPRARRAYSPTRSSR